MFAQCLRSVCAVPVRVALQCYTYSNIQNSAKKVLGKAQYKNHKKLSVLDEKVCYTLILPIKIIIKIKILCLKYVKNSSVTNTSQLSTIQSIIYQKEEDKREQTICILASYMAGPSYPLSF